LGGFDLFSPNTESEEIELQWPVFSNKESSTDELYSSSRIWAEWLSEISSFSGGDAKVNSMVELSPIPGLPRCIPGKSLETESIEMSLR